jgi:hypothetical protein
MKASLPGPSGIVLIIGILLLTFYTAAAQSTIATVPSTDVVAGRKVYLEFDFISQYANHHESGFQSYVPRAVVGIGHSIEVGANLVYTDGFGVSQPIEIQPGVKWQFYRKERNGIAAAAGAMLYTPLTHRAGTDTFVMLYTVISKKVAGKFGPRLTGGGYALAGRNEGTGARGGPIIAYEQPLVPRVSFVMDWFGGRNRFGYVTPGLSFATTTHSLLYTGYSIGNQGRRNNALFTYYGITF